MLHAVRVQTACLVKHAARIRLLLVHKVHMAQMQQRHCSIPPGAEMNSSTQPAPFAGSCFNGLATGSLAVLSLDEITRLSACHCATRVSRLIATEASWPDTCSAPCVFQSAAAMLRRGTGGCLLDENANRAMCCRLHAAATTPF